MDVAVIDCSLNVSVTNVVATNFFLASSVLNRWKCGHLCR